MNHSLHLGADRALMARKPASSPTLFEHKTYATQPAFSSPSNGNYYYFPFNSIAFLAMLVLKLAGFQISLFLRLCTFPIRAFNLCLMFAIFPFQMVTHLRDHVKKTIKRALSASCSRLVAFICDPLRSQKSVMKMVVRFSRGVFCAAYVFFVLLGLLVSDFVIGGFIMRNLVRESVHTIEPLNFDYSKISPVAIVPIASSLDDIGVLPSKLKLTVSLTLPESEYNRKLGIFQVRVETLSDNGEVILSSSYPTMLRFKSQPVRACETLFNSVHLMAGLKSEVQNLKIVLGEFNAGHKPSASFKVILEQRSEFQGGSGVPEIYGGSLEMESKLPKLKRVLWNWRRTLFVWMGFGSFMAETMVVLILFKGAFFHVVRRNVGLITPHGTNQFEVTYGDVFCL